jgi:unsaturated chondroitin disaccharide hydrolase
MNLDKNTETWLDETLGSLAAKMAALQARHRNEIPAVAKDGRYDNRADGSPSWSADSGLAWWTNGCWGGIYNQLYSYDKDPKWLETVKESENLLDAAFIDNYYGLHHDVGFMWLPTSVARYLQTGDDKARRRGLLAAQLLAGRFNSDGNFIRAWNDNPALGRATKGWAIIDCLMNISLLYWASKELDDPRYASIATKHADKTMHHFIRENGSVRHIVEFDAITGEFVRDYGGQGMQQGSSWSRGQSWAIYGFANAYRHTGKPEYLATSEKVAGYVIGKIPADGHIPVDFDQDPTLRFEDSTAAAIIASGLLELDRLVPGKGYGEAALRLLRTLTEDRCDMDPARDGILAKCTASYNGKDDREVNFVYADYFFIEALLKLKDKEILFW